MSKVIGVISGLLGILQFSMDNFPKKQSNSCVVRVSTGLASSGGLENPEGGVYKVHVFNQNQERIGWSNGKFISNGGFVDIKVDQGSNRQQAAFATIEATADGICIPYMSATWVDEQKYGWVGDIGSYCGQKWYYSNYWVRPPVFLHLSATNHFLTMLSTEQVANTQPRCTWVDRDHSHGVKAGMIMVHWPSFHTNDNWVSGDPNPRSKCGYPGFRAYKNWGDAEVTEWWKRDDTNTTTPAEITIDDGVFDPNNFDGSKWVETDYTSGDSSSVVIAGRQIIKKRTVRKLDPRLVISNSPFHKASELCESETSFGPDFVSLVEGMYCNMETSELLPLCTEGLQRGCFHLEQKTHVKRDGVVSEGQKEYEHILDWTTSN
ncbi:Putative protein of unknown function [Podospora comata]|uniref:Uncharacterized protein n=1 Tax=Podospora comata TaxID=48703 RepID=A0ABY6S4Z1_PODCO|nr:Putative protein of unknown function [Podospora comata]